MPMFAKKLIIHLTKTSDKPKLKIFTKKYCNTRFEKECLLEIHRPAIHSDFIWINQIFLLKFSETPITWLKIQIFLALNMVGISI